MMLVQIWPLQVLCNSIEIENEKDKTSSGTQLMGLPKLTLSKNKSLIRWPPNKVILPQNLPSSCKEPFLSMSVCHPGTYLLPLV